MLHETWIVKLKKTATVWQNVPEFIWSILYNHMTNLVVNPLPLSMEGIFGGFHIILSKTTLRHLTQNQHILQNTNYETIKYIAFIFYFIIILKYIIKWIWQMIIFIILHTDHILKSWAFFGVGGSR